MVCYVNVKVHPTLRALYLFKFASCYFLPQFTLYYTPLEYKIKKSQIMCCFFFYLHSQHEPWTLAQEISIIIPDPGKQKKSLSLKYII